MPASCDLALECEERAEQRLTGGSADTDAVARDPAAFRTVIGGARGTGRGAGRGGMNDATPTACRRYRVSGRVQGVGFRDATRTRANELGLAGWVRNLSDGRVEVQAAGSGEKLDALADWIAALGVELQVRVIFLVRSQDELAESEYNQMVKLMRETRSPAAYADALEGADYAAECAAWAARFGAENIQARVYDGAAGDAVARFIDCLPARDLPAPEDTAQDAGYANRSIGARALLAARLLNGIEIEARQPLYRKLFAGFAAAGDLPAVLLSAAQARALRDRYAESNARFARAYLDPAHPACRTGDLGGRRHDDATRDRLFAAVRALGLGEAGLIRETDSARR